MRLKISIDSTMKPLRFWLSSWRWQSHLSFPIGAFERRKYMNLVVHRARHPELRDYIHYAISGLLPFIKKGIATVGNSLFFLGSRLGDSLLLQYTSGVGASMLSAGLKDEVRDIEGDAPSAKRLRMSSFDALQDMISGEELSLYGLAQNNAESAQRSFSFAVRDSLVNVGPLKDFSYGLRINADANATGIAK